MLIRRALWGQSRALTCTECSLELSSNALQPILFYTNWSPAGVCSTVCVGRWQSWADWGIMDRIFKERGYERDEYLFRTVIKISKIKFTQFLHTSASNFFLRAFPRYYMLQPMLNFLFYIPLLSSKILVLFGLDSRAGNSKFQRPKIPARSGQPSSSIRAFWRPFSYDLWPPPLVLTILTTSFLR